MVAAAGSECNDQPYGSARLIGSRRARDKRRQHKAQEKSNADFGLQRGTNIRRIVGGQGAAVAPLDIVNLQCGIAGRYATKDEEGGASREGAGCAMMSKDRGVRCLAMIRPFPVVGPCSLAGLSSTELCAAVVSRRTSRMNANSNA